MTHARPSRQFEDLVARIEADAGAHGMTVKSPDRIRCKLTGKLREVDASIRTTVGTSHVLITIECRRRRPTQDVTWIEQLATKKASIGAARTIAVSSSGFSAEAGIAANHHGIDLRALSEVSAATINQLIRLDFVLFTHKRCSLVRVGLRCFRAERWTLPGPEAVDVSLPPDTDLHASIFRNTETGRQWSINDLWQELQRTVDPFAGIEKGAPPVARTACFPYPGNVTVATRDGEKRLGDVLLTVALALDVEQVGLEAATKVEYTSSDGLALQRVEFASREPGFEDWRVALQIPKDPQGADRPRTRLDRPKGAT